MVKRVSREMKDSGIEWIGDIPSGWNVTKHKWVMQKEKQLCKEYSGEDIISLTMKGIIKRDLVNPSGKMPASFDGYQRVRKGNLLLCLFDIDVTPRCVGLINDDGLTSPAYSQYKMLAKNFAPYYDYLLRTIDDRKDFLHLSKNLRSSLKEDDFGNICTIKPPIEKQKAIAGFLDYILPEIESIVERTKSTIEDYKLLKQSIITEAVTKGLDKNVEMKDSGIEWIGGMPNHWQLSKLKYEFRIKKEIAGTEGYDVLSVTQNGLKVKDITMNEGQMAADYSKYQFVKVGDYVMNHMDLLTGWVDYSTFNGVTSPDYRVFYMTNSEKNSPEYYKYIFQSCYKNKVFYGLAQGVSNLGRWRLQADKFLNFYIPIPPKEEQDKITEYIISEQKRYDEIISKKEMLLLELEQYKKSLIYEYVTGKKEVE